MLKTVFRWIMGILFVIAGSFHFLNPAPYLQMMPAYLPWHLALIYISGIAEILGGLGVLVPATRRVAGWGLIALLIAVFPANIQATLHGFLGLPAWILWARLPFQALFIAWVYWTSVK